MFLARDGFVRTNRREIAMMFVRLSVCTLHTRPLFQMELEKDAWE